MAPRKTIALLFAILCLGPCAMAQGAVTEPKLTRQTLDAVTDLHMPFIENKGQSRHPGVAYIADTFACRVSVTRDGQMIYHLPQDKDSARPVLQIKERLVGADVNIDVRGLEPMDTRVSYLSGRNPSNWQSRLQTYGRVNLGRIDHGIRVELRAGGRNVEKLFYVQPGADPSKIRLAVEGVDQLTVGSDGRLELSTSLGAMRFSKPVAYQQIHGQRRMVPVRYRIDRNGYGFELGVYDVSRELVIDPLIKVFPISHCSERNLIMALEADRDGNIYAAGVANSRLAIFKLDRRLEHILNVVYFSVNARYRKDIIHGLALDTQGNVVVAGTTHNINFPTTPGCHDDRFSGGSDFPWEGFVAKFSADLGTRMASTYIGGDWYEEILALAVNARDEVYVAGYSKHSFRHDEPNYRSFPMEGAPFDSDPAPTWHQKKAVIAKLDPSLTRVMASTYLGGKTVDNNGAIGDTAHLLAIDGQGDVWVAGRTSHPDFPVTAGCLDSSYNGEGDIFLAKFDPNLSELMISTHIGGSGNEGPSDMLFDNQGNLYLLGWTFSGNFPMPAGGWRPSHGMEEEDGFLIKLNAAANEIQLGSFIGADYDGTGFGDDVPAAMALSQDNAIIHVVGRTESENFPTTPGCYDAIIDANNAPTLGDSTMSGTDRSPDTGDPDWGDGFVLTLTADLKQLLYSTYIGGWDCDYLDDVLINGEDIIVVGEGQSMDFPMIENDNYDCADRGVILRFNASETPINPGSTNNAEGSGGGGGGGGCFVSQMGCNF